MSDVFSWTLLQFLFVLDIKTPFLQFKLFYLPIKFHFRFTLLEFQLLATKANLLIYIPAALGPRLFDLLCKQNCWKK
jgi:hypothetical protein